MTSKSIRRMTQALLACVLATGLGASNARAQVVCDQTSLFPRPIQLGISGGNIHLFAVVHKRRTCASGTLGALVEDGIGQYILSNNHVIGLLNHAHKGGLITQPGLADTQCTRTKRNSVATFSRSVKMTFARRKTNTVDASIAITQPGLVEPQIRNIGDIASTTVSAGIAMAVQKMGRTTCLTSGEVSAVGVNVTVGYDKLSGKVKPANFVNQIMIAGKGFAGPGDSGSLILTEEACPQAVGLLFAGSDNGATLANPISDVLTGLGVSMVGTCSVAATVSAASAVEMQAQGIGVSSDVVAAAAAVRDRHNAELMKISGAVGTGIGVGDQPGSATIEVYVTKLTAQAQQEAPSEIEGTPVRLVETGEFKAL
jgi:hypothetical protein